MSIYKGSRYEYSTVDWVATELNGAENPIVFYAFTNFNRVSYYEHLYVNGERLDQLSSKYYKTPRFWWMIAEANPQIDDFTNIKEGTLLRIPRV